jgi:pimeloyl-ACP methyl ester carboxylesterase
MLARSLALAAASLLLGGCVSSLLAHKVVAPPNKSGIKPLFADWEVFKHAPEAYAQTWTVSVGPPAATLSVASIEPGDYGFVYDVKLEYPEGKPPRIAFFNSHWKPSREVAHDARSRGTVLLLHGYLYNKSYMTPWALRLAQAGFRCVLVDLRGHGLSTGDHIGFGAFEAHDLSQVLDDLQRRGWDVSQVGIFGVSYGASVGLLTAGRDPRVAAVVAFEPFYSAERAVPELMRSAFADEARGITDRQFADAHLKEARYGGFAWRDADIPAALARTHAPVLFIHGEKDNWVSPDHSRDLMKLAPPGSKLILAPLDNHVSLPLQIEPHANDVIDWFANAMHRGLSAITHAEQ